MTTTPAPALEAAPCITNLDTLPDELRQGWESLRDFINGTPEVQSLLYDMNLLPEQIRTLGGFATMLNIADHFQHMKIRMESMREAHHRDMLAKLLDDPATEAKVATAIQKVIDRPTNWGVTPYNELAKAALAAIVQGETDQGEG